MMFQPDGNAAVQGLLASGRNQNLNAAYRPPWMAPAQPDLVGAPQGDTRFNPFMGTGWDRALDAWGASQPGGVKMAGQFGTGPSPMDGLQNAMRPQPRVASNPMNQQGMRREADEYYKNKYPGAGV